MSANKGHVRICLNCGFRFPIPPSQKDRFCRSECVREWYSPAARFWRRINKTETCWLWTGLINNRGYGDLTIGNEHVLAHRFSWELHNGRHVPDGLFVLHSCPGGDNRACVNPEHLRLGTHVDNMADMAIRGGAARGERSGRAKLKTEQVLDIRRRWLAGENATEIAAEFGVERATVFKIGRGLRWKHLTTPEA